MMFNFPFPFYRYQNYSYYNHYNKQRNNHQNYNDKSKNSITNSIEISNTINRNSKDSQTIFEIFGIKIYTDDLIIIGILFLLYQQNVKDEMLYIILFLLLFS